MMRIPRSPLPAVLAVCAALSISQIPAAAGDARPAPVPVPLSDTDLARLGSFTPDGSIVCNLGMPGPASVASALLYDDDEYYTYLDPAQCAACVGADAARLIRAYVALSFRRVCTITLEYSIIPNVGTAGCPYPDPNAEVCSSRTVDYTATATGPVVITLDLPDSCQFMHSAFLKIRLVQFSAACNNPNPDPVIGTTPLLILLPTCTQCRSYNFITVQPEDLCVPPNDQTGNPMMYAEAWSCYVPVRRPSWGALKIRYQ